MSESRSNQEPSFRMTNEQLSRQETDADKAINSCKYPQQYELHDSKHWHAACRVPDCRLGFPDFKVGSSCSKSGYKNVLEEPLRRSRSLASRRLGSVSMLPSLLSNLTVSRTRSEPCIFGKDYLRITLPLPGEPSDCGISVEGIGSSAFESMVADESPGLAGMGTRDNSLLLESSTSHSIRLPENTTRTISSGNDSLFIKHNFESIGIGVSKDNVLAPEIVGFIDEKETSENFRVDISGKTLREGNPGLNAWSLGEFVDTPFDETAASRPLQGVSNSCWISRTIQWDDWTRQSKDHSGSSLSRQLANKSSNSYLAFGEDISIDQADEEGSDKGYLVLEELDRQQLGRLDDEDDRCDEDDEESISNTKQFLSEEEEVLKEGGLGTDNNSKGCNEDDIWADEHFVSSQVKGFPPPISILANETHPGLPGHMPRTLWRSVKRDGRFVLQEVQAQPREFFRATREFGRLRLQLVRPDSDPVQDYREAVDRCIKDSAGADSIASERTVENLSQVPADTIETGNCPDIHEGFSTTTHVQRSGSVQPEGLWTVETNVKSDATLNNRGSIPEQELGSSTSLPMECGTVFKGERAGAYSGCAETCGISSSQVSSLVSLYPSDAVQGFPSGPGYNPIVVQIDGEQKGERMGVKSLSTEVEVGQVEDLGALGFCNHSNPMMPSTVHRHEEQFRQDYQHPCFSTTYAFDNNHVLSTSQTFMQFPIQPAVR